MKLSLQSPPNSVNISYTKKFTSIICKSYLPEACFLILHQLLAKWKLKRTPQLFHMPAGTSPALHGNKLPRTCVHINTENGFFYYKWEVIYIAIKYITSFTTKTYHCSVLLHSGHTSDHIRLIAQTKGNSNKKTDDS